MTNLSRDQSTILLKSAAMLVNLIVHVMQLPANVQASVSDIETVFGLNQNLAFAFSRNIIITLIQVTVQFRMMNKIFSDLNFG